MDDALRVDHDLDRVVVDIVQPVGFDDLQALVRQRRRVDRDLGAHRPRRVRECLGGGHARQLGPPPTSRNGPPDAVRIRRRRPRHRFARRGTARARNARSRSAAARQAGWRSGSPARASHRCCRPARLRHDEVATGDERLLVCGRDDLAGLRARRGPARRLTIPPVPTTTRSTSSRVASSTRSVSGGSRPARPPARGDLPGPAAPRRSIEWPGPRHGTAPGGRPAPPPPAADGARRAEQSDAAASDAVVRR